MKDIYKNPVFYFILVPALICLWPFLVAVIYLPGAQDDLQQQKSDYKQSCDFMEQILTLDPDRLELIDANSGAVEFNYTTAVYRVASACRISDTNYSIRSRPARTAKGQKSQSASITLNDIDITKFATFLSTIQLRWASLQCESISLTPKKGLKDVWKADISFKYYY